MIRSRLFVFVLAAIGSMISVDAARAWTPKKDDAKAKPAAKKADKAIDKKKAAVAAVAAARKAQDDLRKAWDTQRRQLAGLPPREKKPAPKAAPRKKPERKSETKRPERKPAPKKSAEAKKKA